jgi:hypothetical protein
MENRDTTRALIYSVIAILLNPQILEQPLASSKAPSPESLTANRCRSLTLFWLTKVSEIMRSEASRTLSWA